MSTVLLKNCQAVVSCNPNDEVFSNVDLLIKDGFIAKIAKNLAGTTDEIIDCKDFVI